MNFFFTLLLWLYGPQAGLPGSPSAFEGRERALQVRTEEPRNQLKNPKAHGNHTIIVIDDTHFFPPSEN